jgi:hypothetical protein
MYFLGLLLEFLAFFIKGCQMVVIKEPQNLYIRRRCGLKCTQRTPIIELFLERP